LASSVTSASFLTTPAYEPKTTQDLINFAIDMQQNGKAEETITSRTRFLRQLSKMADLKNPEQVKNILTTRTTWNKLTRRRHAETYDAFLRFMNIQWTKPHFMPESRFPFIPTETEIDELIASCGNRTATLLPTLKETGIRISEAVKLKWTDLSTEQKTLNITPAKGSNPRLLRVSDKLLNMLNQLSRTRETIFSTNITALRTTYTKTRKITAKKLQNERILRISFHTFRHWKGTMEYHKTKDMIHVKQILGHKSINNTMIYINFEQALFLAENDQWTCKTASNPKQVTVLIETGFEYVTELDGLKFFKKRK
jgi:integrase